MVKQTNMFRISIPCKIRHAFLIWIPQNHLKYSSIPSTYLRRKKSRSPRPSCPCTDRITLHDVAATTRPIDVIYVTKIYNRWTYPWDTVLQSVRFSCKVHKQMVLFKYVGICKWGSSDWPSDIADRRVA